MEAPKMTKKAKIGLAVAVAVAVVAILLILLWPSSASANDTPPAPKPPEPPTPPTPGPAPGPDPMAPTTTPTKGCYYIVKSGDSDSKICENAGFATGQVYQARKKMRDHALNAWIPKVSDNPATSYDEGALNLFQGWAPLAGKEGETWAWKTERLGWGGHKWPIVYVPTDSEVTL
jgi:hypothetical protein